MSVINDTWRFLVQRRLWPVAILLVAAAVAVPMLLAKDPAPRRPRPDRGREGRQGRRAGRGPDRDPGLRRRPQRPPPGARLPQGPVQAQGHADSDARSRRPPRRRSPATSGGADRRGRWRTPSTGASPAPDTTTPVVRQEEEVRAVRADGALRRSRRGQPPRKRRQAPAGPAVQRRARADLPRRARRQEDRGLPARLGRRRPGRRRLPAVAHQLRDDPHPRGRDRVLRRPARATARPAAQYELDVLKIRKTTTTNAKKARRPRAARLAEGPA